LIAVVRKAEISWLNRQESSVEFVAVRGAKRQVDSINGQ
jgi:hypothetical protein